jgi:ubiquinone/menaquinone biosynthesis C-methylase UbiE
LEAGSGTGHFTGSLAEAGFDVVGLDRAWAMIDQAKRRLPAVSFVQGDAHQLPFRLQAFDVVVFVTTIEFLDRPLTALKEAVRVARQGVVAIVLNRYSLGGLSRRWGWRWRRSLLGGAHDYSLGALRRIMHDAAGPRFGAITWSSTLFPDSFWAFRAQLPLGEVLGVRLQLKC